MNVVDGWAGLDGGFDGLSIGIAVTGGVKRNVLGYTQPTPALCGTCDTEHSIHARGVVLRMLCPSLSRAFVIRGHDYSLEQEGACDENARTARAEEGWRLVVYG
jgi:hypothetical protein